MRGIHALDSPHCRHYENVWYEAKAHPMLPYGAVLQYRRETNMSTMFIITWHFLSTRTRKGVVWNMMM